MSDPSAPHPWRDRKPSQAATGLVDTKGAARIIGVTAQTVLAWSRVPYGPPPVMAGGKRMYRRTDCEEFLREVGGVAGRRAPRPSRGTR